MDVREFVIAFSVVCRPTKTLETIKLAFTVCVFSCCVFSTLILDNRNIVMLRNCTMNRMHV